MSKYAGKIIRYIWSMFPEHPDFEGLDINKQADVPEWWKSRRLRFERQVKDFHRTLTSDFTFGVYSVRPLFLSNNNFNPQEGLAITDPVSAIDLELICKSLMRQATVMPKQTKEGPLQKRAWLVLLMHAAGRPSENKFVDLAKFMSLPGLQTVNCPWTDKKTKKTYGMALVPDCYGCECDVFHALASYIALEDGLYRSDDQRITRSFLFPDMHGGSDNSIAKKTSKAIRDPNSQAIRLNR